MKLGKNALATGVKLQQQRPRLAWQSITQQRNFQQGQPGDGSGEGGNGNGGDGGGGDDEAAKRFAQIANSAVTAQLRRMLPDAINGVVKELGLADVNGKIDSLVEAMGKRQPPQGTPPAGPPAGPPAQGGENPETANLRSLVEQLTDRLEKSDQKIRQQEELRTQLEHKQRFERGMNDLRSALEEHVKPEVLDFVVRDLARGQERLAFGDDGNPLLRVDRPTFKGSDQYETVDLPFREAIPLYIKSKEAAPFIPAPGGNAGNRSGPPNRQPQIVRRTDGQPLSDAERNQNMQARLARMGLSLE